ncbi:MAG TPA: hypothetical protein VMC09_02405 [Anaerolineales bacterium]|nr:hypothetical protein [Anaerolineales bacterium]
MVTPQKIEEWIKEAEERPESGLLILKLIAGRLRDLTERNEELLSENIALQDGTRVEEYRKRIAYLENQLEILTRRLGESEAGLVSGVAGPPKEATANLLAYTALGRILRIELVEATLGPGAQLGCLTGELQAGGEPVHLMIVREEEELLLLFTSGRISTHPVGGLRAVPSGEVWSLDEAGLPDEPHAGEQLACILPLSRLVLSDYFMQASRRGFVKKTMTSMAQSVLENHYLGRGAVQKTDRPLAMTLCKKGEQVALATLEGHLLGLNVDDLSYTTEERLRLEPHDHVVSLFGVSPEATMVFLTQSGKVIQRAAQSLEPAKSALSKGQALISPARLEQGVRFVGAAAVHAPDRILVLDAKGNLSLHLVSDLAGSGALPDENPLLTFCVLPGRP